MTLTSNFGKVENDGHRLSWIVDNISAAVDFEGHIDGAAYSPENALVLVITGPGTVNYSDKLYGFSINGDLVFESNEPKEYWLYYLASHVNHETAVVCISKGHKDDWYFSINPKTGKLEPLNRAY